MSHQHIDFLIPERRDPNFWESPEKVYASLLPKQSSSTENTPNTKLEKDIEKARKQKLGGLK